MEERQRKIDAEKKQREYELEKAKADGSDAANKELIAKGLASLGLDGKKTTSEQDELAKRKNMMANLKQVIE